MADPRPIDEPVARTRARQKASFLLAASALILAAHAVDLVQAGGPNWRALGLRLAWAGAVAGSALVLLRASQPTIYRAGAATAFLTIFLFLGLLWVTGRSGSPLFSFTLVLVVLLPLLMDELYQAGLVASALLLVGAGGMLARDGASAGDLLGWGHAGAAAFAVAWLLSAVNAQTQRATEALGSAREDALSRLAASERQRLEAERLAALGRLAATVAHELNGPLGAARSSAKFVREAVRERGEVAEACSDVVAALDRMALVVRQLGDLTRSEPAWSAPPPHSR